MISTTNNTTNYRSLALNYSTPLSTYDTMTKPEHRLDLNRVPNSKDLYQKSTSYSGNGNSEIPMTVTFTSAKPSKPFSANSVYGPL